METIEDITAEMRIRCVDKNHSPELWEYLDRIEKATALKESIRPCDVGTAEEQAKRLHEFCWSFKTITICGLSPCNNCPIQENRSCKLPMGANAIRRRVNQ